MPVSTINGASAGSSGTILTTTSPKAGNVIQVVQGSTSTPVDTSGNTFQDTGLSLSITPTSTSSKILILASQVVEIAINSGVAISAQFRLVRGSTVVRTYDRSFYSQVAVGANGYQDVMSTIFLQYLDSPATTSSTTYKFQGAAQNSGSGNIIRYQPDATGGSPVSIITLMEIAG